MKTYVFLLIGLLVFFSGSLYAQPDDDDTQIWGITTYEFPLERDNKKLSGVILSDLRLTEDISNPGDLRFGFGVNYKVKTNINIQPSYVFRVRRISGRSDRSEHRLRFDLTPKKDFRSLSVDNRSRFEHRIKHGGRKDDTFYRNRTRIRVPIKRDDKTVVIPFVYDDIWFDLQNGKVFRNDLSGGVSRKITNRFSADLFYRHRRNFRTGTRDENIFGLKIYLRFKKE